MCFSAGPVRVAHHGESLSCGAAEGNGVAASINRVDGGAVEACLGFAAGGGFGEIVGLGEAFVEVAAAMVTVVVWRTAVALFISLQNISTTRI